MNVAFHYLGCARSDDRGVCVPSPYGPWIEGLADAAGVVTVVAYDPPSLPSSEDATDYLLQPERGIVRFVSLGPKGSYRTWRSRRRHVAEVGGSHSAGWDVVVYRLPNRRAGAMRRADRCTRVVVMSGGHGPSVTRATRYPFPRNVILYAASLLAERQHRRMMQRAGAVFANSSPLAQRYTGAAPDVRLLRTSSRHDRYVHHADDRLTSDAPRFVVAGRVSVAKGVIEAFDAFALVLERFPRAQLHVLGDGDAMPELRSRASVFPDGAVTFHGWVSSPQAQYDIIREMDVLLMLSHAESFPRVVWDAMAHSVLVVATPVGGLGTDLEDGEHVVHVPVGDARAAAGAVFRLADDAGLRHRLLDAARGAAGAATVEAVVDGFMSHVRSTWPELGAQHSGAPER